MPIHVRCNVLGTMKYKPEDSQAPQTYNAEIVGIYGHPSIYISSK